MRISNQIIVNEKGNSWLGFHSSNKKLLKALDSILEVSKQPLYESELWKTPFWILDFDGSCVSCQNSLAGAINHYNDNRILVHTQKVFI